MNILSNTRCGIGLGFYSFFRVFHKDKTRLCPVNTLSETFCGGVQPFGCEYKYIKILEKLNLI